MKKLNGIRIGLVIVLVWTLGMILASKPTQQVVAATCTSASSGNWSEITWSGCTPGASDDVIIAHNVTLDMDVTVRGITINNGVTFNGESHILTLNADYFTNNGFFEAGNGTVRITGANFRLYGNATTFNNVTITGNNANFSTVAATINGVFTIEGGNVATSSAPIYADGSTLRYATGGSYTAFEEWYPNTTSGAGVPYHVEITSGTTLTFGNNSFARTMRGNLRLYGTFALSTSSGGNLNIAGSWLNDGTFTHNGRLVTFNGNGNRTISGSSTTAFDYLTVNLGSGRTNVLDVQSQISITTNRLVLTNGTFRLSNSNSDITLNTAGYAIESNAGLWVDGGTIRVGTTSGSLELSGLLRVSAGTLNIGNAAGNSINYRTGSAITIEGGTINIAARIGRDSNVTTNSTTYTQSGGVVTVVMHSSTSTSYAGFDLGRTESSFTMSGGTIVIQNTTNATVGDFYNIASTYNVTGGTLQIGNSSTPNATTIRINSTAPIWNLTVDGSTSQATKPTAQVFNNPLTAHNDITIGSGATLNGNNLNINIAGDWTNNGIFTPGTGTVTFNGSAAQSIAGSADTTFYNLTIANSARVTLNQDTTVTRQLTINATDDVLNAGSTTLTMQGSDSVRPDFLNNGTFNAGTGIVAFAGHNGLHGRVLGSATTTFNDVTLTRVGTGHFGVDFYDHNNASARAEIAGIFTLTPDTFVASEEDGSSDPCAADQCDGTPIYLAGSTLRYITEDQSPPFDAAAEWWIAGGSCGTDPGLPYNVVIDNDTTVNIGAAFPNNSQTPSYPANSARLACDSIAIENGSTLQYASGTLAVEGTVTNNGAIQQTLNVGTINISFAYIQNSAEDAVKYYGVEIDPDSTAMESTTVIVYGNQLCPNATRGVKRCFDIAPTTSTTATVRFYYTDGERNGETNSLMKIYHRDQVNNKWDELTGTYEHGGSGVAQYVQLPGITTYSPFALSNNQPTAITLAAFSATPHADAIRVTWETASELDNLGFHLYRSASASGPWTRLNATLIPPQFPGQVYGGVYEWLDTEVTPGVMTYYRLEDVDRNGARTFHGPVWAVMGGARYRVYLPLVVRP